MSDDLKAASQRKANFGQTLKAVLWGMMGIRRGKGYQEDAATLNPVHLIIAGLVAAAVFVAALVLIVRWVAAG